MVVCTFVLFCAYLDTGVFSTSLLPEVFALLAWSCRSMGSQFWSSFVGAPSVLNRLGSCSTGTLQGWYPQLIREVLRSAMEVLLFLFLLLLLLSSSSSSSSSSFGCFSLGVCPVLWCAGWWLDPCRALGAYLLVGHVKCVKCLLNERCAPQLCRPSDLHCVRLSGLGRLSHAGGCFRAFLTPAIANHSQKVSPTKKP